MSAEPEEWPEWKVEELRQAIDAWAQRHMDRQFVEMVVHIDEVPDISLKPGEVILFGEEGQVDAVWVVPEPLPDVLYRPIPPKLRLAPESDEVEPSLRMATYDRIADRTYQRRGGRA